MKFLVSRTSCKPNFVEKEQPCENAVITEIVYNEPHFYFNKEAGDTTKYWEIEINTLEELIEFYKKCNNEIILTTNNIDQKSLELEIYDYYRE